MSISKLQEILALKAAKAKAAASSNPIEKPIEKPVPISIGILIEEEIQKQQKLTKLQELKAKLAKANGANNPIDPIPVTLTKPVEPENETSYMVPTNLQTTGMHGEVITYNNEQQSFIDKVKDKQSCVLIGAAGTGKTTCSQGGINALIQHGSIPTLDCADHRHLKTGAPGIIICAYTRRAVNNIRKVQSADLQQNCITVHKLLEYAPEIYEIEDIETGETKKTMKFIPTRNSVNPLPKTIHTIIIEEASMLSLQLYNELLQALEHPVQWIFIGDIQQLPPVFGPAILGFKMLELPVVELTQVYRQALESPIIKLAHRILSGIPIPPSEFPEWHTKHKLTIHPWKKKLHEEVALLTTAEFFKKAIANNVYNVEEDMILIPFNKGCGTIELNKHIANYLSTQKGTITYEVMAGFNKYYFSVNDKVLYDREDAEILEILPNPAYTGARVQPPSVHLDYWGHNPNIANESTHIDYGINSDIDIDLILSKVANAEERVTQSSHKITIKLLESEQVITIDKAADVNSLLHSYALTVHKSQGSEWRKVFVLFHQSHATMLQRELLYTAVTRAREELYVICEPESFTKGIVSQRIKGNTLAEKAEYFKGKITEDM